METKLSIVIITKNEELLLPRLLKSIKVQTVKPFEIIVADNDSTDKTQEIARAAGCRIVKGGLPSEGRDAGASHAKGNLIIFFDADADIEKDFLEKPLRRFEQRKLGVANFLAATRSKNPFERLFVFLWNWVIKALEKTRPLGYGHCILVDKETHNKLHGFDKKLTHAEDIDYFRRALGMGKFGVITTKVYVSSRRFKEEGYLWTALRLTYTSIMLLFFPKLKLKVKYELDIMHEQ